MKENFRAGRTITGAALISKAMAALNAIAESSEAISLAEISRVTGIPRSTLHRILSAMVESRMVRHDPKSQTYQLGYRVFELAHRVWQDIDVRAAAAPELDWLLATTGETARLAIFDDTDVLVIDQRDAQRAVRLREGVGARIPAWCSASGKAILAFMETEQQNEILSNLQLSQLTPHTLCDRAALRNDLALTGARGYAINDQERTMNVRSVAAPIMGSNGVPIAAIGVLIVGEQVDSDRLASLGHDVMEAARRASGNAGSSMVSTSPMPRPPEPVDPDVTCVLQASAFLAESPLWSAPKQQLYWVDILAPALHCFDPAAGQDRKVELPLITGSVVAGQGGELIAATQRGIMTLNPTSGAMKLIADPEQDLPGNRFNDSKCDRAGRLWAGTVSLTSKPGQGSLYRIDSRRGVTRMDTGFTVSNGIGWSPDDQKMYFTDSHRRTIWVYDFDLDRGEIANRRVFVQVPPHAGMPDGLTVDAEGYVWSANWDGWCVTRYTPSGKVDRVVRLPVPRPTSCMFGGAELNVLYVTSGRIRMSARDLAEAPLSGGIFALRAPVPGVSESAFAG